MAINISFNGAIIRVPGCYGPGESWTRRFVLRQFLEKLNINPYRTMF
jgi:hypothetical protein